jgi:hypothetical protein
MERLKFIFHPFHYKKSKRNKKKLKRINFPWMAGNKREQQHKKFRKEINKNIEMQRKINIKEKIKKIQNII